MMKLYDIAANEENLKRFNENPNGVRYDTVDNFRDGLGSFEDKLNNMLSEKIDALLTSNGLDADLEKYLPSDRIFYKKVTKNLVPDEENEELASKKVLDTFLMVKADEYYHPSAEQLKIMQNMLDYTAKDNEMTFYSDEMGE